MTCGIEGQGHVKGWLHMLLLVVWCCDLHIEQMLNLVWKGKNPVLLILQQIQIFVRLSPICKHSLYSYWNENIIFNAYWYIEVGWHTHRFYTHIMWINKTPNKKGWHKQPQYTNTHHTLRGLSCCCRPCVQAEGWHWVKTGYVMLISNKRHGATLKHP